MSAEARSLVRQPWVAAAFAACLGLFLVGLQGEGQWRWGAVAASGLFGLAAARGAERARWGWAAVLGGALLLRAAALAWEPRSTGDLPRYAWEAQVLLDGRSPYAFAPQAPELRSLGEREPELFAGVEFPEVPAAYPPIAQLSFVASAGLERAGVERFTALRLLALAADLGVLAALARLARRRGLPAAACAAWAWSPLVALEFSGAGHFDALGIALTWAAFALEPAALAFALLGMAAAVKYLPLLFAPWLARRAPRHAWLVPALLALSFAPLALLDGGLRGVGSGLTSYGLRWEATSALFRFLDLAVRALPYEGLFDPRWVARALAAAAWLACAAWVWRRERALERASFALLGSFLLLSPTLHPWYVTWIVPFLCFRRSLGFEWLSAAAPLAYVVLERFRSSGEWHEPAWLWPALFAPCLLGLALDFRREGQRA